MNKSTKEQLTREISNAIWNIIKHEANPEPFSWKVIFKTCDEEEIELGEG